MTFSAIDPTPLGAAGLPDDTVRTWLAARPGDAASYAEDRRRYSAFWQQSRMLVDRLPRKVSRNEAEQAASGLIVSAAGGARDRFLSAHVQSLYDELTSSRSRFLRVDELVYEAATLIPGLTPTSAEVAADSGNTHGDKDGIEIDQGIFLAHVLADERAGSHLCHAMLLPRNESEALAPKFAAESRIDLGPVRLARKGGAVHLTAGNPRFLNAEDDSTLDAMEIAVDLAILDPTTNIAVLRGGKVEHEKYRDLHVFGAGINLTHLYRGKIPYLWFVKRDMGYVHKLYRGVARPDAIPDDVHGRGIEKPWIAAVEEFAIGGHCQLLLVMDYVLAADHAFLSLPARKEGIIPGLANLRLPRFVGDRLARQAIQAERRFVCDSAEGRLIVDELVPATEMDAAIDRAIATLTDAGSVSAIGNRRALRIGQEPLDVFRRYCALYAREQAFCHFSPALMANLERNWNARSRKL